MTEKDKNEIYKIIFSKLRWYNQNPAISDEDIMQEIQIAGFLNSKENNARQFYTAVYRTASNELSKMTSFPLYIGKLLKGIQGPEDEETLALKLINNKTSGGPLYNRAKRLHKKHGGDIEEILYKLALNRSKQIIGFLIGTKEMEAIDEI